ncbi:MAG: type II toxin-antitoxin system HicA family toxin [Treponema sp.]|jgi:predicted RNA binding protein YcfA (HicA-like mRNA interferase family)|nr:type II toxin-antitoxin system HicA family toxin [Treponema sp.]
MKRGALLKILRKQGCVFVKHGGKHDQYMQPRTGRTDQVPRHTDISEDTAKSIIKNLSYFDIPV